MSRNVHWAPRRDGWLVNGLTHANILRTSPRAVEGKTARIRSSGRGIDLCAAVLGVYRLVRGDSAFHFAGAKRDPQNALYGLVDALRISFGDAANHFRGAVHGDRRRRR